MFGPGGCERSTSNERLIVARWPLKALQMLPTARHFLVTQFAISNPISIRCRRWRVVERSGNRGCRRHKSTMCEIRCARHSLRAAENILDEKVIKLIGPVSDSPSSCGLAGPIIGQSLAIVHGITFVVMSGDFTPNGALCI